MLPSSLLRILIFSFRPLPPAVPATGGRFVPRSCLEELRGFLGGCPLQVPPAASPPPTAAVAGTGTVRSASVLPLTPRRPGDERAAGLDDALPGPPRPVTVVQARRTQACRTACEAICHFTNHSLMLSAVSLMLLEHRGVEIAQ